MRWDDLDFENSVLTVRKSKTEAGQGRVVDLNSVLREVLHSLRDATPGEWVFPSPKTPGEHIGDVKNSFRRAVQIAGIPHITFHQLRHTFCSRLGDGGVAVIQELAGHASILTTHRYMHPANELKRKAVEALVRPEKNLLVLRFLLHPTPLREGRGLPRGGSILKNLRLVGGFGL